MTNRIKITIVIISYNQVDFLEDTIRSVVEQTYENKEVVLIDGGSTDGSIEIINKYSNHFSYWVSEPDHGQSDAIIKGFNRCTGDLITWLNSDDLLEEGILEKIANLAQREESYSKVFYGKCMIIDEFGQMKDIAIHEKMNYFVAKTLGPNISQPGTFWARNIYFKVGGINKNLKYGMDRDLFCNFLFSGVKFYYSGIVHSRFRRYSRQKGHSKKYLKECELETQLINNIYGLDKISKIQVIFARSIQIFNRLVNTYYIQTLLLRFNSRQSFREYRTNYTD